jgi:hypothetical protein
VATKTAERDGTSPPGQITPTYPAVKISVVGNAQSLFDQHHGKLIDSAGSVIRFNGGIIVKPACQGRKTTVLAYSFYRENLADFGRVTLLDTRQLICEREVLENALGCKPSNGIVVLEYFRGRGGVHVFGFDWKQTPTWYRQTPGIPEHHDYRAEKEYCLDMVATEGWVIH